jgi:hypothetical protein
MYIAPVKYQYSNVDAAIKNRMLFQYWFTVSAAAGPSGGIVSGGEGGYGVDFRLGVGPSGRESLGVIKAVSVAVSGSSSDFDFSLRTTPLLSSTSGTQHEVYQKEAADTWFKTNNINVPYRTAHEQPLSAALVTDTSAAAGHNGASKLWGYIKNNTTTAITHVYIELLIDVDQAMGSGFGWWDPNAPQNAAWKSTNPPLTS